MLRISKQTSKNGNDATAWRHKINQRYGTDYHRWTKTKFDDPATLQEEQQAQKEKDLKDNDDFEIANSDFCNEMKQEMKHRQEKRQEKQTAANKNRLKGNKLYARKRYSEALNSYKEAAQFEAYNFKILNNMALCYFKLKDWEEAIEYASRSHYLDEQNPKPLFVRSKSYLSLNNIESALNDFNKVVSLMPGDLEMKKQQNMLQYESELIKSEMLVDQIILERGTNIDNLDKKTHSICASPRSSTCFDEVNVSIGTESESLEILRDKFSIIDDLMKMVPNLAHGQNMYDFDKWADKCRLVLQDDPHVRTYVRKSGYLSDLCSVLARLVNSSSSSDHVLTFKTCSVLMRFLAESIRGDSRSKQVLASVRSIKLEAFHLNRVY